MIITHAIQLTNNKSKQLPLCAVPVGDIPPYYVTSLNTNLEKRYWVYSPQSVASSELKAEQAKLNQIPNATLIDIPLKLDRYTRQILLPKNASPKQDAEESFSYQSVSPVESLGLLHEVYRRIANYCDMGYFHHRQLKLVRDITKWREHTELMVEQEGNVLVMAKGLEITNIMDNHAKINAIGLRLAVENISILNGFVAIGHPSITSIGIYVHTIEKALNQQIRFAVGIEHIGLKKGNYGMTGERRPVTSLRDKEIAANIEIIIMLDGQDNQAIYDYIQQQPPEFIAGGNVVDYQVASFIDTPAPNASYLFDSSAEMLALSPEEKIAGLDTLDKAMEAQNINKMYTSLNHIGYAMLESPIHRDKARNGLMHSWAEPIYGSVSQSAFNEDCWWYRSDMNNGALLWSKQGEIL